MNRLDELAESGKNARFAGRVSEAALYYEEGYKLAVQLQMDDRIIEFGEHAISNLIYFGNSLKSLNLVVEILHKYSHLADSKTYIWLKLRYFTLLLRNNPSYDKLISLLEEIEKFSIENDNLLLSSIYAHFCSLYECLGEYGKALIYVEKAWSIYSDNIFEVVKYILCCDGIIYNLKIGDYKAANRWFTIFNDISSDLHSKKINGLIAKIDLSLYNESKHDKIFFISSQLEDAVSGFSEVVEFSKAKNRLLRIYLLKPLLKDPIDSLHPSKTILFDKMTFKYMDTSFDLRCERNLLIVDYRLACLRFILGINPVDDYWYQFKQDLSIKLKTFETEDVNRRIRKVKEAINYAKILAKDFDTRLNSTLKMEEIKMREDRLNEIVEYLGLVFINGS